MSNNGEFPFELGGGKIDPQLFKRILDLYNRIHQLEQRPVPATVVQQAVVDQLKLIGLLGPLGQSLLGQSTSDPQLQNLPTGNGTVTSASVVTANRFSGTVATATSTPAFTLSSTIGEYLSNSVPSGSAVALTTGAFANITSITLTPGDWDVWGDIVFLSGAATTITAMSASLSTTSATGDFTAGQFGTLNYPAGTVLGVTNNPVKAGPARFNVAVDTPVYLVAFQSFGADTLKGWGFLGARRV